MDSLVKPYGKFPSKAAYTRWYMQNPEHKRKAREASKMSMRKRYQEGLVDTRSTAPYGKYSSKNEYMKHYYQTPEGRAKMLEHAKHYREKHIHTKVDGKDVCLVHLTKDVKPEQCTLCGRATWKLDYHHWDNGFSQILGLWLCSYCHIAAEVADRELLSKYFELKELVEMEFLDVAKGEEIPEQLERGRIFETINGKRTMVQIFSKRPKSISCELCKCFAPRAYHHWDENNRSKGMWLCSYCHTFVELVDQGLVQKYLAIRQAMGPKGMIHS